tara:strand:+ start:176 stop:514 length:339 start_codon:yes stop_codon:yes gene_type:complete
MNKYQHIIDVITEEPDVLDFKIDNILKYSGHTEDTDMSVTSEDKIKLTKDEILEEFKFEGRKRYNVIKLYIQNPTYTPEKISRMAECHSDTVRKAITKYLGMLRINSNFNNK